MDRLQCWIFIWPYIFYCDLAIVIVTRFATSLDIFVLIISQCWSWIWYSTTFTSSLILAAWLDIVLVLVISHCVFVCLEVCPLSLTTVWLSIILQPEKEFSKLFLLLLNICDSDVSSTSELEVSGNDSQESTSLSSKLFTRNSAAPSVVHNLAMFWKIKYETLFLETFAYYHGIKLFRKFIVKISKCTFCLN